MARSNRKKTKPAVKSNAAGNRIKKGKLGYGQYSRNYSTLKNLEKVKSLEEEAKPLNDTKENIIETMRLEIDFPNAND